MKIKFKAMLIELDSFGKGPKFKNGYAGFTIFPEGTIEEGFKLMDELLKAMDGEVTVIVTKSSSAPIKEDLLSNPDPNFFKMIQLVNGEGIEVNDEILQD